MTHIGVPESERTSAQRVLVSIECMVDHVSDDAVSINYAEIVELLHILAESERLTLEKFCDDIGVMLYKNFSCTQFVIEVKKFIIPGTKSVSYRLSCP